MVLTEFVSRWTANTRNDAAALKPHVLALRALLGE